MIKGYIRYRLAVLSFYLTAVITFSLVNYLYGYLMEAATYSFLILTFVLVIWMVVDISHYSNKLKNLREIREHLSTYEHILPEANSMIETEYQNILEELYQQININLEEMEKSHTEQVEYYTMWVHQIKIPISAMRLAIHQNDIGMQTSLLEQELFKIEQYVELALHYTKMSNLSTDLVIKEYSLEDMVRSSVKKYATLFIYKKLSIQIEELHEIITTDSKWFSFVLEQLLSNAIKYTNQGGIMISYRNRTLYITDTGIGIRSEDIDRIFEKGYTGYNGRIDNRASGIGLYLVKKVADTLALTVKITSEVGKGTQVAIHIPEADRFLLRD